MADMTSRSPGPQGHPDTSAQREHMIREAAYFHAAQRGFAPGHELEDWLAAEAELFGEETRQRGGPLPEAPDIDATEIDEAEIDEAAFDMHHGGARGAWQDDTLKQIIRHHPQRAIPQVEAMEAREAPHRE